MSEDDKADMSPSKLVTKSAWIKSTWWAAFTLTPGWWDGPVVPVADRHCDLREAGAGA